jgi:DNA-binding CsgD family transcriptional regulator
MEATQTATPIGALACAAAVLGDGNSAAAAARLAGLACEDGERAADALVAAGVLAPERPLRFAHPAARAMIYAFLPPGERAIAHRRAVRVLAEAGADPIGVVAHACSVEPAGDRFVADALLEAGGSALAAGVPRAAALLLERCLAEPPAVGRRAAARLLHARALTMLGDRRAPALTSKALAAAAPRERPAIMSQLVDALWLTGGADAALSLARKATGGDPTGIAAALAARAGSLPAPDIVSLAATGAGGATAFERCMAIAALIACDKLEAARHALDACVETASVRGGLAELTMLERLRTRLDAIGGGELENAPPLPGPDPGTSPWEAWLTDGGAIERFGTPSARAASLLAAGSDPERLERAVSLARRSPRRALLGRALLALGRTRRHLGQRRTARAVLGEALALAERLGCGGLVALARDELRLAGARPRRAALSGPDSLTPAERRVANAAAAGWSNREIAARLYLSPKTVEMHLGRTYRKLEIGSRGELPGALGGGLAEAA